MPLPSDDRTEDRRVTETSQAERDLLSRLANGEEDAARAVVERLCPLVERMAFRLLGWQSEIQDVVQEVFLSIQQQATRFRGDCKLETWATSITIHQCRQWVRQASKRPPALSSTPHTEFVAAGESIGSETVVEQQRAELKEEVQRAIELLRHDHRELIVLRYLEEMSLDEMTRLLQVKKNTIEVRLLRARRELGRLLNDRVLP